MNKSKMIRAWKDEDFRESLSEAERSQLPDHPAGAIELSDEELGLARGQTGTTTTVTTVLISLEACPSADGTCEWGTEGCCEPQPA